MSTTHMSIDEYLALTPEEKRKYTEVIIVFFHTAHQLQTDHQKDHDDELRDGWAIPEEQPS